MGKFDDVIAKISTPVHLKDKADIIEHFKDQYGAKRWESEAAMYISGTTDKRSRAYKSARRDFEGDRLGKPGKTGRYESIGRRLPPIDRVPSSNMAIITVTGKQQNSNGTIRNRRINVTLQGQALRDFVHKPEWRYIWDEFGTDLGGGDEEGDSGTMYDTVVSAA